MAEPERGWDRLRRSTLVQAAGVYAAASWAALQIVDTISGFAPLPEWLPLLALSLIGVGFPVVLATAVVQRRLDPDPGPGVGEEAGEAPSEDEEPADDEEVGEEGSVEAGSALVASRGVAQVLTWRNTILGGVAATLLWAGVAGVWLVASRGTQGNGPSDLSSLRSVAVLPFHDLSPGGDQEYFSDGLAEELLNALAQLPGLRVPARTSSFAFKGREEDVRAIGEALNVEALLEGSVRKQDHRLRITAQLVDARSGFHIWSRTFDGDLTDVFALQEEIARSVSELLRGGDTESLSAEGGGATERGAGAVAPTGEIEAYELYLRGRHALNRRTRASLADALAYFRNALELDPSYAQAHAGLAAAHNLRSLNQYVRPEEGFAPGLVSARRALELDDGLVDAHAALAMALYLYAWDWEGAEEAFRRALELDPNNARARYFRSMYLSAMRRNEEAILEARRAARLDPLSGPVRMGVGMAYFHADRLPEAVEDLRRTASSIPDYFFPYAWLGLAEVQLRETGAGLEASRRAVALNPGSPLTSAMLAEALGRAGEGGEAREILRRLEARSRSEPVSGTYIARAWIALGENDRALGWLERAVEWREGQVIQIRGPGYDPVRLEPRFRRLVDAIAYPGD